MAKNKIELIKHDRINEKYNESEIFDYITKTEFYNWLYENKYTINDIIDVFNYNPVPSYEQYHFNNILRKANRDIKIPLHELVLFIEENFIKLSKIMMLLDEDNKQCLKEELAKKHNIKLPKTALYKLLI